MSSSYIKCHNFQEGATASCSFMNWTWRGARKRVRGALHLTSYTTSMITIDNIQFAITNMASISSTFVHPAYKTHGTYLQYLPHLLVSDDIIVQYRKNDMNEWLWCWYLILLSVDTDFEDEKVPSDCLLFSLIFSSIEVGM